jgi:hypothetical protein
VQETFLFFKVSRAPLVPTGGSFPGVKQQGCKPDHSPSSSAEVMNKQSYSLHLSSAFIACNFIFALIERKM